MPGSGVTRPVRFLPNETPLLELRYLSSVTSHQARNVIDDKIGLLMIK